MRPTPTKPMFIGFKCRISNLECRRNTEIRMTKMTSTSAYCVFDHSSLFRHSSFVLCHFGCGKLVAKITHVLLRMDATERVSPSYFLMTSPCVAKKGLWTFSSATDVIGPWPGQMIV